MHVYAALCHPPLDTFYYLPLPPLPSLVVDVSEPLSSSIPFCSSLLVLLHTVYSENPLVLSSIHLFVRLPSDIHLFVSFLLSSIRHIRGSTDERERMRTHKHIHVCRMSSSSAATKKKGSCLFRSMYTHTHSPVIMYKHRVRIDTPAHMHIMYPCLVTS